MDYTSEVFSQQPKDVDAPIIIDADCPSRTISWKEYVTYVKNIAVGLREFGIRDKEAVGLMSNNDLYYYVLGDGVVAAGGIFVPMPTSSKQVDLGNCLRSGDVKYLFAAPDFTGVAVETFQELGLDRTRLILFDPPGLESTKTSEEIKFSKLLTSDGNQWSLPAYIKADPEKAICQRQFTSGTTGIPKAAEISNACSMRRFKYQITVPDLPEPRFLHYVPMFHPSGIVSFMGAVKGFFKLYLTSTVEPVKILDLLDEYKINRALIAPYVMDEMTACVRSGSKPKDMLQSLKWMTVSGSAPRAQVLEDFRSLIPDLKMLNVYGATEAHGVAATFTFLPPPFAGMPPKTVEVKIIDVETTEDIGHDKEGEICCRSMFMFSGYHNNPEATAAALLQDPNGKPWYRTGDKGFIDSKTGLVAITGRFKDLFRLANNEDVSPAEVETELAKHPSVADVAVTSTPSRENEHAKEVIAYVVRKDGEWCTAQDVLQFVASRIASYKAPTGGVIFVSAIPRNAMEKAMKRQLETVPQLEGSAKYLNIIERRKT